MTTNHNPGAYLAFANLQMAAEAFLQQAIGDDKEDALRKALILATNTTANSPRQARSISLASS